MNTSIEVDSLLESDPFSTDIRIYPQIYYLLPHTFHMKRVQDPAATGTNRTDCV
jgi:hypothetical protein